MFRFIFFGNYFMGLCAVALSLETCLQLQIPFPPVSFLVLIFSGTVLFYTHAYLLPTTTQTPNPRQLWYQNNQKLVRKSQTSLSILSLITVLHLYPKANSHIPSPSISILAIPLIALLYYGLQTSSLRHLNLRRLGLLKPFIIGFVWAGVVTLFPATAAETFQNIIPNDSTLRTIFLQNFTYISLIAIMFDIKDYADDSNVQLKTLVVRIGLRRTLRHILMPAILLNLLWPPLTQSTTFPKTLLQAIPHLAMLAVTYALQRRHGILFYLVIIDGLLLLKAIATYLQSRY